MRFVAQKGTNRICFSSHSTEKHSPPLGNPFLRSKYHFRSLGNTFLRTELHFRSLGNTLLSPKNHFQSSKSPVRGKKMHPKVFFSLPLLGKKKSNATSKKVALPYIIRNRINGSINLGMNVVYHLSYYRCATCE
jgi:hypothetical protein